MMEYDDSNGFESQEIQQEAEPYIAREESSGVTEVQVTEDLEGSQATGSNEETRVEEQSTQGLGETEADSQFTESRRQSEANQIERMQKAFGNLGFTGTPDEIADAVEAHFSGRSVEEVRQARVIEQQEKDKELQLFGELEYYKRREMTRVIEEDLKTVQRFDPKIKDIGELGDEFFRLRAAGVDTEIAFNAVNAKKQAQKVSPPPIAGKVNAATSAKKDFYTSEEVDRLTEKDLDDPIIYANVAKSMPKW